MAVLGRLWFAVWGGCFWVVCSLLLVLGGSVGIGVLNSSRKGVESSCVSEGIGEGPLSKFSHLVSDWRIPFFHPDLGEVF